MVHKRTVAVVVDSGSCLPPELVQHLPIYTVPHNLIIDDRPFRDGIDVAPAEFYRLLQENNHVLSTSSPTPVNFLEAFRSARDVADSVVCITLSTNFSSTFDSATVAASMAQEELPGYNIKVMDSKAAAGAEGLIALDAARAAQRGANLDEVVSGVQDLIPEVNLLAFLDTLYYLRRSGRVPRVVAWAGALLGIKPLTEMRLGEAKLLDKPRSRGRATERLLDIMKGRVEGRPVHVNVMHAHSDDDAKRLSQRLEREFDCRDLFVSEFTPVMGAHLGPGLLGVAFYTDT